jgi:hypothetical protein
VEHDPLIQRSLNLPFVRWHIVATFQACHVDLGGTQANRRASYIDGHIAAPQHQHSFLFNLGPRIGQQGIRRRGTIWGNLRHVSCSRIPCFLISDPLFFCSAIT